MASSFSAMAGGSRPPYGQYVPSNPSSTHSSPRTYPADLEPYYPVHANTYPIPGPVGSVTPYNPAIPRRTFPGPRPHSYAAPMSLQVSTSGTGAHEHDPNERTARPGNAHVHAQFHSQLQHNNNTVTPIASTSHPHLNNLDLDVDSDMLGVLSSSSSSVGVQQEYPNNTPGLSQGLTRPLKPIEQERLAHLDRLKFFLATAPARWDSAASNAAGTSGTGGDEYGGGVGVGFAAGLGHVGVGGFPNNNPALGMAGLDPAAYHHHAPPHPALNRFLLPNQEFVTCVLWNGLYHITGTDIVRALVFRFEAFGRPVRNMKKFEEGVFSDLRNLKPGVDACLEEPKSPFLDLLFKYQCIRTQKKQKVFYWFSVPHDRLFLDALERDLKREKMGLEPTTTIVGEPALSFTYDSKRSLYEQFSKASGVREGEGELEAAVRRMFPEGSGGASGSGQGGDDSTSESGGDRDGDASMTDDSGMSELDDDEGGVGPKRRKRYSHHASGAAANAALSGPNGQQFLPFFSIFEGSPTYKQRRKKGAKNASAAAAASAAASGQLRKTSEDRDDGYERGRSLGLGPGGGFGRYESESRERYTHPPIQIPNHPSMMDEFGHSDIGSGGEGGSAADMFLKQARGELVPADGIVRNANKGPTVNVGDVGVYYSEGNPHTHNHPLALGPPGQTGHARGRSLDGGVPGVGLAPRGSGASGAMSASYATTTFADAHQLPNYGHQQHHLDLDLDSQAGAGAGPHATGLAQYEAVSADGKVRAFVCPLYSCGRLFKRMEHLKRHLRTHTLERPFECTKCAKKFSRSDNLTQHLRTHERSGSGGSVGGGGGAPNGVGAVDVQSGSPDAFSGDEALGSAGYGHMEMYSGGGGDGVSSTSASSTASSSTTPSSLLLNAAAGANPNVDLSIYGFPRGFSLSNLDQQAQMCEVEIPMGGVQDVVGDEEGLLMRTGPAVDAAMVYRFGQPLFGMQHQHQQQAQQQQGASGSGGGGGGDSGYGSGTLFSAPTAEVGWGHHHSQQHQAQQQQQQQHAQQYHPHHSHHQQHQQQTHLRGGIHSHSSSSSSHGYPPHLAHGHGHGHGHAHDLYGSISMSAPSHKQSFDHATMYSGGGMSGSGAGSGGGGGGLELPPTTSSPGLGGGIGPVRRHRSMTPSLVRGEPRRPMTANSDYSEGSPASVHSSLSGGAPGSGGGGGGGGGGAPGSGGPGSGGSGGGGGGGASRGYHPYAAGYSASNSRSSSTHNSPQVLTQPLGVEYGGLRRSDSRSSSAGGGGVGVGVGGSVLVDQMQKMMNVDSTASSTAAANAFGEGMYRSESPASFGVDIPMGYHHSTQPSTTTTTTQQQQQQSAYQQGGYEGYYNTHSTI